jgi:hypothetical protein
MSGQTADQPPIHVDNITAHPGSTFAGAGLIAMTIGQAMSSGMPTGAGGWAAMAAQVAFGVLGALGK